MQGRPLSVFIQAVAGVSDGGSQTSIGTYAARRVFVDVYAYHSGQDSGLSVFSPVRTFELSLAAGSANSVAKYWHVFDIVKQGSNWVLTTSAAGDNGTIRTDFVDILNDYALLP